MAWSWSHTAEAYEHARENVMLLSSEDTAVIWAEISCSDWKTNAFNPDFNLRKYKKLLLKAHREIYKGYIERFHNDIWDFAETWRVCDDDGYNAYVCPFGCHTVSFEFIQ